MLAGRQPAVTVVFALALFGKNVRFMQLAWFLAIIREISDAAGTLARGMPFVTVFVIVVLVAEIAAFIYTGAIASGHVAKYKPEP